MELVKCIDKVVLGLFELHKRGIIHTDLTDFNVLVRKSTREPVIIDLLGCISAGSQKFDIHKDYWVFVHHFLIPTLTRRGLYKQEDVVQHFSDYNRGELERYMNFLHKNMSNEKEQGEILK
jgi:RIO-like serine/threonine protein kinase